MASKRLVRNSMLTQSIAASLTITPRIMSFLEIKTNKQIFKIPPDWKAY